jgi:hypothetical protein
VNVVSLTKRQLKRNKHYAKSSVVVDELTVTCIAFERSNFGLEVYYNGSELYVMTTMKMATTIISVARRNNKRKATMMNQIEDEDKSTPLLAAVADGGRSCFSCRIMKKRVDFPRSLCKIQTECRACLSFRGSGSIETHEEESAAEKYLNECHYQQQHYQHYQPKPHFVLIHGAEIV